VQKGKSGCNQLHMHWDLRPHEGKFWGTTAAYNNCESKRDQKEVYNRRGTPEGGMLVLVTWQFGWRGVCLEFTEDGNKREKAQGETRAGGGKRFLVAEVGLAVSLQRTDREETGEGYRKQKRKFSNRKWERQLSGSANQL